jgi:hypothetical protein
MVENSQDCMLGLYNQSVVELKKCQETMLFSPVRERLRAIHFRENLMMSRSSLDHMQWESLRNITSYITMECINK